MKRKNLMLLLATTVVACMMLAGCGEAASSAGAEVSTDASIEAATEASSEKTSDVEAANEATNAEDADALNSSESTSSTSNSSADEAATALSVPEFSSDEEEEQWVLEQISGVWETAYKPADLCVFEGKEVTHYTANTEGVEWPEDYTKENKNSQIVSFQKKTEDDDEYYRIELSGFSWVTLYWRPSDPYFLECNEPYSGHGSFERPYGYSNDNKITIDDYKIVE